MVQTKAFCFVLLLIVEFDFDIIFGLLFDLFIWYLTE